MGAGGRKAWLVTWKGIGDHARLDEKVVAAFKPATGRRLIAACLELIYAQLNYSAEERVAVSLGMIENPYPATFPRRSGTSSTSEVHCGDNPFLRARLVDALKAQADGTFTWNEK